MAFCSLGGRSDDWLGEFLVFLHPLRHLHSADSAFAGFVLPPGVAGKVTADDHLDFERLAFVSDSDHRVRNGNFPVRKDVLCRIQELRCNLVQHLSFEWDSFRENHVEC